MKHSEFVSLLKNPDQIKPNHVDDLRMMLDEYPYFAPARLLYAKALQRSESVMFGANLRYSSVYTSNKRWLYYFLYPEKPVTPESGRRKSKRGGDYFELLNKAESGGGDVGLSLKNLADKLRSARALVTEMPKVHDRKPSMPAESAMPDVKPVETLEMRENSFYKDSPLPVRQLECTEDNAKKMIREQKYFEAIEILKDLSLNNPKKSVYFADQIRFLEKVIENIKK